MPKSQVSGLRTKMLEGSATALSRDLEDGLAILYLSSELDTSDRAYLSAVRGLPNALGDLRSPKG